MSPSHQAAHHSGGLFSAEASVWPNWPGDSRRGAEAKLAEERPFAGSEGADRHHLRTVARRVRLLGRSPGYPAPVRDSPLQFAVVREDPSVEARALGVLSSPRVLLVASGGCTALSLQARFPDATFTLVDPNPAQHALVREKVSAWSIGDLRAFNVGDDAPLGLSERGNFESLFRLVRAFLHEMVAPADTVHAALRGDDDARTHVLTGRYWPVAFDLHFSDAMLVAMFGPAAVQHAPRGSYPRYFRGVYERALTTGVTNGFAWHLLTGRYPADVLPDFLTRAPVPCRFEHVLGTLGDVPDFGAFDLVHLSNVLDWTDREAGGRLAARVARELRPGAAVSVRQLNNCVPIEADFPGVRFIEVAEERSLFYTRTFVGRKA